MAAGKDSGNGWKRDLSAGNGTAALHRRRRRRRRRCAPVEGALPSWLVGKV